MSRRASQLEQLTIRGFDADVEAHLRALARREGLSLNRAVQLLLRRGAGLAEEPPLSNTIGNRLDDLIGTWSDTEARELGTFTETFEQVDEGLWR